MVADFHLPACWGLSGAHAALRAADGLPVRRLGHLIRPTLLLGFSRSASSKVPMRYASARESIGCRRAPFAPLMMPLAVGLSSPASASSNSPSETSPSFCQSEDWPLLMPRSESVSVVVSSDCRTEPRCRHQPAEPQEPPTGPITCRFGPNPGRRERCLLTVDDAAHGHHTGAESADCGQITSLTEPNGCTYSRRHRFRSPPKSTWVPKYASLHLLQYGAGQSNPVVGTVIDEPDWRRANAKF